MVNNNSKNIIVELPSIGQAYFSLLIAAAGNERSFKVWKRVPNQTLNRLTDKKADRNSFIVFNSAQLGQNDSGINKPCDYILEKFLGNGLLSESGKELRRIARLTDLADNHFDRSLDTCQGLPDFDGLKLEFYALLKIN